MADMRHFDATGRPPSELSDWLARCRETGFPAVVIARPPGRMRIAVDGCEIFNGDPERGREVLERLDAQPRPVTRPTRPPKRSNLEAWDVAGLVWPEDQEADADVE